jgi:hypothetical protein
MSRKKILKIEDGYSYRERVRFQLLEWVDGNSIHNEIEGECCPDFSCCNPKLLKEKFFREKYLASNSEQRESLCFGLLSDFLKFHNLSKKVFVTNGKDELKNL